MGCIRVDKITEYLCEPLRKCLKDEDPYVRKTAAVCVAKLHDINAQLVEDQGFLDSLRDLLSDSNPMVSIHVHRLNKHCIETSIFTCTSKSSLSLLRKWTVSISFLWCPKLNCIPISLVTVWYLVLFEKVNFFSFSYWFLCIILSENNIYQKEAILLLLLLLFSFLSLLLYRGLSLRFQVAV